MRYIYHEIYLSLDKINISPLYGAVKREVTNKSLFLRDLLDGFKILAELLRPALFQPGMDAVAIFDGRIMSFT